MSTNIDTSKAVSKITYNGAEVPMDPAGKMDEFRMAFWTTVRDNPDKLQGKFAHFNEGMIKAILPVPPDEFFEDSDYATMPFMPYNADYMFYACDYPVAYGESPLPDINCDILRNASHMFAYSTFTKLPDMNLYDCSADYMYYFAKCKTIEGLYVGPYTKLGTQAFYGCTELENINYIDGYMGYGICEPWELRSSKKLAADTLSRIVDALVDVEAYNNSEFVGSFVLAELENPTLTLAKACQEKMESTLLNGSTLPAVASQKGWTVVYA